MAQPIITPAQFTDLLPAIRSIIANRSLPQSVQIIYQTREPRHLTGEDSIEVRTLGPNYQSPINYTRTYFDQKRQADANTEFHECYMAIAMYNSARNFPNAYAALDERGDMLFQHTVVQQRHTQHPEFTRVNGLFVKAFMHIDDLLDTVRLPAEASNELARAKYAIRSALEENGFAGKHKEGEFALCSDIIRAYVRLP